jgi:hypothetical protein
MLHFAFCGRSTAPLVQLAEIIKCKHKLPAKQVLGTKWQLQYLRPEGLFQTRQLHSDLGFPNQIANAGRLAPILNYL